MNFSDIKQFKVDKGIAVPIEYMLGAENMPFDYQEFSKQHTYATNAPDGVYDADRFEQPVWQRFAYGTWLDNYGKPKEEEMFNSRLYLRLKEKLSTENDYLPLSKSDQQKIYWDSKAKEKLMAVMFPKGIEQPQLSPENKQEFGEYPSDEYLKSLKFNDKYFSNQYWHPSEEDREYMSENAFNAAIEEYDHANKLVLLDGFSVEFDSCDCGGEYGCSHSSWPFELHYDFGKGVDMQWEDDGFFIESPKGFIRFDKAEDITMYHFVKACELLDLGLKFKRINKR